MSEELTADKLHDIIANMPSPPEKVVVVLHAITAGQYMAEYGELPNNCLVTPATLPFHKPIAIKQSYLSSLRKPFRFNIESEGKE